MYHMHLYQDLATSTDNLRSALEKHLAVLEAIKAKSKQDGWVDPDAEGDNAVELDMVRSLLATFTEVNG